MIHRMNLRPEPFALIASGKKTIELRLYDEKRQLIKVGDQILFTCTDQPKELLVNVKNLLQFANFEALYDALPLDQCGYMPHELSKASPKDMLQYYTAEAQSKYGVIGIEIERTSGKKILFDLDGTLTDSGEGIIKCAKLALAHYGLPIPDEETMRTFVGPPLSDSFRKYGIAEDKVAEAIEIFRSRYTSVGIYENSPYPGIRKLLEGLKENGHRLYIATSKPEYMAIRVLENFGLAHYFEKVCGATTDDSRSKKEDVIAYLLAQIGTENAVMIGDTVFDITGAQANGIPAIGVAWGYGSTEEMKLAGANIANTSQELLEILKAC